MAEHTITLRWNGQPPGLQAESYIKRLAYLISGDDIVIEVDGEPRWRPSDGPPGWEAVDVL